MLPCFYVSIIVCDGYWGFLVFVVILEIDCCDCSSGGGWVGLQFAYCLCDRMVMGGGFCILERRAIQVINLFGFLEFVDGGFCWGLVT